MASKPASPARTPYPADSHEVIRVHGARVNNLRDVDVEIPKRRLTVFTGGPAATLSGGEAQRTKMIRHLGSSLTDDRGTSYGWWKG